jgi:urease subunit gamma/beta
MRLTPTEEERLRVFTAAELARRTLQRGLQLSAPEAVALVCDEMHHAARSGASFEAVAANGKAALAPNQVLPGVANVVPEIRVEVLLEEGSRLIVIRDPFGPADPDGPGAVRFAEGDVALVPDRRRIRLSVTSTSTRPIRISSHYPFWQANARLSFDREVATGFRLDLPAGDSLRWEPGETKEVELVAYGGEGGPAA